MRRFAVSLTILALVATACGGSDDDPVVVATTTTDIFVTTTTAGSSGGSGTATTTTEAAYQSPTTTTMAVATTTAPPATTTEVPTEVPESVTVEAGDSLSKIAKRFGTTVDSLVRVNELCDANQIFVGQVILLEDPEAEEPAAEAEVLIVTVLAGDSLSKIAKRHDTTVDEIMERNAIDDPNLLFVGQELVIDGEVPAPDEPEVNPNC